MAAGPKTRLVVLYGGRSAEHEVSCISAMHVIAAADPERYDVVPIGITHEGLWLPAADAVAALEPGATTLPSPDTFSSLAALPAGVDPLPAVTADAPERTVVLPLIHGQMGEDGTVQGLLELAGVPYCGPGVLASAQCMDKGAMRDVLASHGIPQVAWISAREGEVLADAGVPFAKRVADELGFPVFVKPANQGSSIGITRAGDPDELDAALELALRYDEWIVVEESARSPREIEVAVLGNDEPRASVAGEIVTSHEFYDFDDKYLSGTSHAAIPADLSDEAMAEVRALAVAAYKALRVDGMARCDFLYEDPATGGRGFLCNELNTIPGFTPISMYPKLWEASGLPYSGLVDELVRLAVSRHERRRRFSTAR